MKFEAISAGSADAGVSRAELVGAFSYALDLTEGQPAGHCLRSAWIGAHVGRAIRLDPAALGELHYSILLKDLGCSSNAARICELYQADDRAFKQGFKTVGTGLAATLHFVFSRTARQSSFSGRAGAVGNILRNGDAIAQELIESRCTRGSDIARSLRFTDAVCDAIYRLDEHFDGSGRPGRLRGDAIPLYARIALLAQVVDVFHAHAGRNAAIDEVRRRSGSWFDPALVAAFENVAHDETFWRGLASPMIEARLMTLVPIEETLPVDEQFLDSIVAAFGQVIDAKSPFTAGHSERVADLAGAIGATLGVSPGRQRWLHRAALLHDVGKLGVSNLILDKPASLNGEEWSSMRDHARETGAILGRISALADIAPVAAAHHERLDGRGYPLGLRQSEIARETRIITACDHYDALTADRPYRAALPLDEALAIMRGEIGGAIDGEVFDALLTVI